MDNDYDTAIEYLNKGQAYLSNSPYIVITKFDICEKKNDINGMKDSLIKLSQIVSSADSVRTSLAYKRRQLIFDAYIGKDIILLKTEMAKIKGLSDFAREKLEKKLLRITERNII